MVTPEGISVESSRKQYDNYRELLQQVSLERAISTYFFICINTGILFAIIWISISGAAMFILPLIPFAGALILSVIGIVLCIYWLLEIRESHIMHEVRFRVLMDLENRLFPQGAMNDEWERLGDYPLRRTPVLYIGLIRVLPIMFIAGHGINIILMLRILL